MTRFQAWQAYDGLYQDPRVVFAEEPTEIEKPWRTLTQDQTFSPKVWNDAYLAAFGLAAGFEVITFDKGFARYEGVACTILS